MPSSSLFFLPPGELVGPFPPIPSGFGLAVLFVLVAAVMQPTCRFPLAKEACGRLPNPFLDLGDLPCDCLEPFVLSLDHGFKAPDRAENIDDLGRVLWSSKRVDRSGGGGALSAPGSESSVGAIIFRKVGRAAKGRGSGHSSLHR